MVEYQLRRLLSPRRLDLVARMAPSLRSPLLYLVLLQAHGMPLCRVETLRVTTQANVSTLCAYTPKT